MLISNVGCAGHEGAVIDCPFNFVHDCLITDVAGVQCISKYIIMYSYELITVIPK